MVSPCPFPLLRSRDNLRFRAAAGSPGEGLRVRTRGWGPRPPGGCGEVPPAGGPGTARMHLSPILRLEGQDWGDGGVSVRPLLGAGVGSRGSGVPCVRAGPSFPGTPPSGPSPWVEESESVCTEPAPEGEHRALASSPGGRPRCCVGQRPGAEVGGKDIKSYISVSGGPARALGSRRGQEEREGRFHEGLLVQTLGGCRLKRTAMTGVDHRIGGRRGLLFPTERQDHEGRARPGGRQERGCRGPFIRGAFLFPSSPPGGSGLPPPSCGLPCSPVSPLGRAHGPTPSFNERNPGGHSARPQEPGRWDPVLPKNECGEDLGAV